VGDKRGATQMLDAFRHEIRIRNEEKVMNINGLKSRVNNLIAKQRELESMRDKDKKELNALRYMSQIKYQRHSGRCLTPEQIKNFKEGGNIAMNLTNNSES